MLPWNDRRTRRNGRARRRPELAVLESLDRRELLSYTALGHALPDLTISGYASNAASWGGPLGLTVDLKNIASESQVEPLSLAPGSTSQADAPASRVAVFASRSPHFTTRAVKIGIFNVPAVPQNSDVHFTTTITLPARPAGLPGDGGHVYIYFIANADKNVPETDLTNNNSTVGSLVQIVAPFPELSVVGLDVPPVIQPGDTINPNIRVANFGPVDTSAQGPVTVDLVASVTPSFGPGSSVLETFTVANIPGANQAPTKSPVYTDANVTLPNNVVQLTGTPVTLPTTPSVYYIGVVIDPFSQIKQVGQIGGFRSATNPFSLAHVVGPPIIALPPAGVEPPGSVATPTAVFPFPISGIAVGSPNVATTTGTTTADGISAASVNTAGGGQALPAVHFTTGARGFLTTLPVFKPHVAVLSTGKTRIPQ